MFMQKELVKFINNRKKLLELSGSGARDLFTI